MMLKSQNDPVNAVLTGDIYPVDLRCHSYEEHRAVLPVLLDILGSLGCWVLEQKVLSPTQTEVSFEVQLRTAFELYGGLLAAGLELTRDSHLRLTGLCTLRGHNPRHARRRRVVTIRLELNFLEETTSISNGVIVGLA
jgi:hypothetical protein